MTTNDMRDAFLEQCQSQAYKLHAERDHVRFLLAEVERLDHERLRHENRAWTLRRGVKALRAEVERLKATIATECTDWAETDDRVKALARPILGDAALDGDGYFVDVVQVVEMLLAEVERLRKAIGVMVPTCLRVLLQVLPADADIDREYTAKTLDRVEAAMKPITTEKGTER